MSRLDGLRRAEAGASPIELVLGLALLVLPVTLLVLSIPTWMAAQSGARAAAQEAARVLAVRGDGPAARGAAGALVEEIARNRGLELDGLDLHRTNVAGREAIAADVTVRLPAVAVPFIGRWAAVDWTAHHVEPVDLYRSVTR